MVFPSSLFSLLTLCNFESLASRPAKCDDERYADPHGGGRGRSRPHNAGRPLTQPSGPLTVAGGRGDAHHGPTDA